MQTILSFVLSVISQIGGSEMSYLEDISEEIEMQSNMNQSLLLLKNIKRNTLCIANYCFRLHFYWDVKEKNKRRRQNGKRRTKRRGERLKERSKYGKVNTNPQRKQVKHEKKSIRKSEEEKKTEKTDWNGRNIQNNGEEEIEVVTERDTGGH